MGKLSLMKQKLSEACPASIAPPPMPLSDHHKIGSPPPTAPRVDIFPWFWGEKGKRLGNKSRHWFETSTSKCLFGSCTHSDKSLLTCHFSHVWLCSPMDCSPPGSSVHGILQARLLEWVAISFSRGSSQPRDRTWVARIVCRFFTSWATREALLVDLCY